MESSSLLGTLEKVLDASGKAVLATVDDAGKPHSRWMVAGTMRGASGYLYAVTSADSHKVEQIRKNPSVSWLVQSEHLDEIIQVHGEATIVDNPSIKSLVLEAIGKDLANFWKMKGEMAEIVVIETVVSTVDHIQTGKGIRSRASV